VKGICLLVGCNERAQTAKCKTCTGQQYFCLLHKYHPSHRNGPIKSNVLNNNQNNNESNNINFISNNDLNNNVVIISNIDANISDKSENNNTFVCVPHIQATNDNMSVDNKKKGSLF
jgi:hypothetical protein